VIYPPYPPSDQRAMFSNVALFIRRKYPYIAGFCVIEAGMYYFGGPAGDFNTGFLGLFAIWIYYSWISRP
jgi:hypothetical protein